MADHSLEDIARAQEDAERSDVGSHGAGGHHARRRGAGHHRQPHVPRTGIRRFLPALLVIVVLAVLGGGGVYGYQWVTNNLSVSHEDADFPGPGSGKASIVVSQGDTGTDIAKKLVDGGVIKSASPFVTTFANTPQAAEIQPGIYTLKHEMTSSDALEALLDPDNRSGSVTIPEGMRASQIYQRLADASGLTVADFEKAAEDTEAIGLPDAADGQIEGYLFPATYSFAEDASATDMLGEMVARSEQSRTEHGVSEEDWHRVLTEASLVQKEGGSAEDYPTIARVIENRLNGTGGADGKPMKLQFDSTVAYVSGKDTISTTAEDRAADSPYNTYKVDGLPAGPICSPGDEAISAALSPAEGDWIYFVTVNTDTGETVFSTNKADHDKAVQQWQEWAKNKGDG